MEDMNGRPVQTGQESDGRIPASSYTLPGVLHFIQHEWTRFERERSKWDVERAELQARIAYLQGERRGQEHLKHDLVRRIKMLEYALRQERVKYHRLKYGCEPPVYEPKRNQDGDSGEADAPTGAALAAAAAVELRPGRQLLRQYLQEIGYTDNMLDMRAARRNRILGGIELMSGATGTSGFQPVAVTSEMSGLANDRIGSMAPPPHLDDRTTTSSPPPGTDTGYPPRIESIATKPASTPALQPTTDNRQQPLASDIPDEQTEIDHSFEFLEGEDDDDDSDGEGVRADDEAEDERSFDRDLPQSWISGSTSSSGSSDGTEDAMRSFDFLNSMGGDDAGALEQRYIRTSGLPTPSQEPLLRADDGYRENHAESGSSGLGASRNGRNRVSTRPSRSNMRNLLSELTSSDRGGQGVNTDGGGSTSGASALESLFGAQPERKSPSQTVDNHPPIEIGLGALEGLSVSNEGETSYEKSSSLDQHKSWNPKFSLKSHFDCVRSVTFHPTELLLLTASEDRTVKLWNLEKATPTKKSTLPEVEPIHTFRGHRGAVLSCAFSHDGEYCFSAGTDSKIARWAVPPTSTDLYSPYESEREALVFFEDHTNAIWDLAVHKTHPLLASTSADGRCCLWNWRKPKPLVNTLTRLSEAGTPTCVDFVHNEPGQVVVGYTSAQAVLFDYETSKAVCLFDSLKSDGGSSSQVNKVVCHPTLEITVAALEDRLIQFLDNRSGQLIHSMVAHLDAVTSLSIDPNGLYLLSGSHDSSLRLWNMESRTCVQEMTSHRKKYDESIFSVAFHPNKGYFASGGADAIAKVFV